MLSQIRILVAAIIICGTKCSRVVDIYDQRGLNVSNYCPRIGECGEGSHVMCLYNSAKIMGPACYDFLTNVTITPDYAELILRITNRIRSKIANGQVKAKNGLALPKGYGLFKVVWDEELATFAQVWANQCVLRLDLCRSSKRFPNVGQAIGMTRLTLGDWMPIHKSNFNGTTLTTEKVKYAVKSVMKAWWDMKEMLSAEDMKEFNKSGPAIYTNKFLNLVHGPLTHVGCGISVYKEYAYKDNMAQLFFNCIQIVCNFSTRPKYGEPIYTVEPPTKPGYTVRCGCPVGFDEDDACLCYESGRKIPYACKSNDQCKPSVAVLPIFTVEDAPTSAVGNNNSALRETIKDVFNNVETLDSRIPLNNHNDIFKNFHAMDYKRDLIRRLPSVIESHFYNKKPKMTLVHNTTKVPYRLPGVTHARRHFTKPKQSIFSKAGIFELPIKKRKQAAINLVREANDKGFKKDVAPRKDYTKVQIIVSNYLDKKRNGKLFDEASNKDGFMSNKPGTISKYNNNITMHQNIRENKIIKSYLSNFNKRKNEINKSDTNASRNDDTNLMYLLDELEEEVRKNNLNSNEKGMFHEKIRNIYGTLVGKPNIVTQKVKLLSKDSMNESIHNIPEYVDEFRYSFNKPKHIYSDFENNYLRKFENQKYSDANSKLSGIHENIKNSRLRNTHDLRENYKSNHKNRYSRTENDEYYPLSDERRRYYRQKLAYLQRKLINIKRSDHPTKVPEDQHIRQVRPTKLEKHQRRSRPNEHVNTYYMPDRARFLHGF